uniref:Uncharacterized protein n=1 Tax=Amphiprion percula TaxID=161767 RepID=A0A3P8THC2_AMPPE
LLYTHRPTYLSCFTRKRSSGELSDTVTPDSNCIVGVRTALDRLSVNPSLFMVKYDGYDCVCGIELFMDESIKAANLVRKVNNKIKIPSEAEELVGKNVEHLGMVLSTHPLRASIMTNWYYITYEKDPILYMYQLWDDYFNSGKEILEEPNTEHHANTDACQMSYHSYFTLFEAAVCRFIQYKTEDRTPLCNTIEILNEFKLYKLKIFVVLLSLTVGYLLLCRIKTNNLDLLYHNY